MIMNKKLTLLLSALFAMSAFNNIVATAPIKAVLDINLKSGDDGKEYTAGEVVELMLDYMHPLTALTHAGTWACSLSKNSKAKFAFKHSKAIRRTVRIGLLAGVALWAYSKTQDDKPQGRFATNILSAYFAHNKGVVCGLSDAFMATAGWCADNIKNTLKVIKPSKISEAAVVIDTTDAV
jgi:hypothetical protein